MPLLRWLGAWLLVLWLVAWVPPITGWQAMVVPSVSGQAVLTMPLLTGGRLRGRVDTRREGTTLVAKRLSCEPGAADAMAGALREAAEWVGCDSVALEAVDPPELAKPLRAALA